jgi:hypothetical protein
MLSAAVCIKSASEPIAAPDAAYFFLTGGQVHFSGGCLQPEHTLFWISRPHFLQGLQPHVWHMTVSFSSRTRPATVNSRPCLTRVDSSRQADARPPAWSAFSPRIKRRVFPISVRKCLEMQ